ncbi:DUF1616 domain-containing protein [Haloarcula laminariae]|uniref:DUF1616 domain-containing protein n=1 Tax=Haloarcula laminariae TaxID=2961577 RepID=UPI0021C5957E|nr:DUF1616 domain-containing protein [Halomicroarcula laminariae]
MRSGAFLLCALVVTVGIAVGSGGFTSAQADRGVTVEVVGDGDAYMALDYPNETVERDGVVNETMSLQFVTVTNQFPENVTLTVNYTVQGEPGLSTSDDNETTLNVGESTDVSAPVTCPSAGDYDVSVEFGATADGPGIYAETSDDRTVEYEVSCE